MMMPLLKGVPAWFAPAVVVVIVGMFCLIDKVILGDCFRDERVSREALLRNTLVVFPKQMLEMLFLLLHFYFDLFGFLCLP